MIAAWQHPCPVRPGYREGVADYISRALVADALTEWRALLRARSSVSPLRDLGTTDSPIIDLAGSHPSGLAPLFAGRATLLSTLLRDPEVFAAASHSGRLIIDAAEHIVATTGAWTAALVVGTVAYNGVEQPLLLRPVTLERARDNDISITLRHEVHVNPVVASAVREGGGPADLASRAARTLEGREFDPRPLWDEVRGLTEVLPGVEVHEKLLLGAFDDAEQRLLDDLDDLDAVIGASDVVAAIAGDADAATILAEPLPRWGLGDRDPFGERGIGDLDDEAFRAVDLVALGRSVSIDAPPGVDATAIVAAIAADAAASGRTSAVVGGSDETLAAVEAALNDAGAGDAAMTGIAEHWHADARARLLASLTLDTPAVNEEEFRLVGEGLLRARSDVASRYEALHRPRRPWGASAFDAVQAIVRLTASEPSPGHSLRLSHEAGAAVAEHGLAHVAAAMIARLHGTEVDVPSQVADREPEPVLPRTWWSQVAQSVEHGAALDEALAVAVRLLPSLRSDARAAATETGLDEAVTLDDWREQVHLFLDVQSTLDTFSPAVYHRSLADLVDATAPRTGGAESTMDRSTRRALVRRASELLRPGRDKNELHAHLAAAAREAERWRDRCSAGGWPVVPDDFGPYAVRMARLDEAWAVLAPVLPSAAGLDEPGAMPLSELIRALEDLTQAIPGGIDRAPVSPASIDLDDEGFAALLESLRERDASPEQIRVDLEFAWWAAAFDAMIGAEPRLIETGALGAAVERYLELDRAFGEMRTAPLMRAVAEQRRQAIARHPEDARDLFASLMEGAEISVRDMRRDFGAVVAALRPIVIARADQVPHMMPAARCIDVLIVVGIESLSTAEIIPALGRATQVVMVADGRSATRSAVADIARLLPRVPLRGLPQRRDPRVGAVLQSLGYERTVAVVPPPGEAGEGNLDATVLDAVAQPIAGRHVVESTRAEALAAAERVVTAVGTLPRRSVLVVAGNALHAARIVDALNERDIAIGDGVRVVELGDAAGLNADEVIISLGFARDHRGVLPAELGILATPAGGAALAQALVASRVSVAVLTALSAHQLQQLADGSVEGNGVGGLAALIEAAGQPPVPPERARPGPADWLLSDVARLLRARGCAVRLRYGVGDQAIPLVVGGPHDRGYRVAVVTDEPADGPVASLRDRVRWQYRRLEALGWTVVSLWTVDVFVDPVGAADAVMAALGTGDEPNGPDVAESEPAAVGGAGEVAGAATEDSVEVEEVFDHQDALDDEGEEVVDHQEEGGEEESVEVEPVELEPVEVELVEVEGAAQEEVTHDQDEETTDDEEVTYHQDEEPAENEEVTYHQRGVRTPIRGVDRPLIPTRAWEDEDAAWGERGGSSREDEIRRDKPPHW